VRLTATIITRNLNPVSLIQAKLAREADRILIITGACFEEPNPLPDTMTPEEFEKEVDHPNVHVVRMYAYWKHPGEKVGIALHNGSLVWEDWYLYIYEGDEFKITPKFKDVASQIAEEYPLAYEIVMPTVSKLKDRYVVPGEGWYPFPQRMIKFQEGLHLKTRKSFMDAQGVDLMRDPTIQLYRILPENLSDAMVVNSRMNGPNFDKEYEEWFAKCFGYDYDFTKDPELMDMNTERETAMKRVLDFAPNVRRIQI